MSNRRSMVEGDVTRLPQWAQRKIQTLQQRVESLEEYVADINTRAHPGSNVRLSNHLHGDFNLPPDSEVDFYMGNGRDKWTDVISVQHLRTKQREVLRIAGDRQLVLLPSGGCNCIEIRQVGFDSR